MSLLSIRMLIHKQCLILDTYKFIGPWHNHCPSELTVMTAILSPHWKEHMQPVVWRNQKQSWTKGNIMKTRVLIVDDHGVFRKCLKAVLDYQSDMEVIGEAEDGEKAVALTRELHPDIILMDVKMPVMDGTEATRRILAEMPDVKILALSIYADDGFMDGIMLAGAKGYILKGCDSEELSDIIRKTAGSRKM